MSVAGAVPQGVWWTAVANAAAALASGEFYADAAALLVELGSELNESGLASEFEYLDLPTVITWIAKVEDRYVEIGQSQDNMGPMVRRVLEQIEASGGSRPPELVWLLSAYEAGPKIQKFGSGGPHDANF